jgi:tetratricopeptide (TPR) repeat protein
MNSRNATGTDVMTAVLALEKQGRPSRTLRLVDALLAAEGPSPELIAAKARALAGLGRFVDALATADFAVDLRPDSAETLATRAEVLEEADRHQEALTAGKQALSLDASNLRAMRARALALANTGALPEAMRLARRVVKLAPDDDPESASTLIMVTQEADPAEACRIADAYVARRHDAPTLVLRSVVRLLNDDEDGALADAREASALDPDHEMAAMCAIVVSLAQGQLDEVIIQAEAATLKENLTAKLPAGLAYLESGRPTEAEVALLPVTQQQPQNLDALACLRRAQLELLKWGDLTLTCTRILALSPDDTVTLLIRARAYCETDQPAAGVRDTVKILAQDPASGPALTIRAYAGIMLDSPQQALADANAAIAAGAGVDSLAPQARMVALMALGRRREAESAALQVLRSDPDDIIAGSIKKAADERWQGWVATAAELAKTALNLLGN